jgi:hypothetical protein
VSKAAARIDNPVDPTLVKELLNKLPDSVELTRKTVCQRHHSKIAGIEEDLPFIRRGNHYISANHLAPVHLLSECGRQQANAIWRECLPTRICVHLNLDRR